MIRAGSDRLRDDGWYPGPKVVVQMESQGNSGRVGQGLGPLLVTIED